MAAVFWLNGPGLRLIAPRVAAHYLEKAGLRGNFKVGGSFTGGLSLSDLTIEGDAELASLSINKIEPHYEWRGLIKGEIQGLTVEGVHADLRLGLEKPDEPEKPPLDLQKLAETIRSIRGRVIPLKIELKDISLAATREEETLFLLAPSSLTHAAGSDELLLNLGEITDPQGTVWPSQRSVIRWEENRLLLDRLDPMPGLSVREFVLQLPVGGEPSADTQIVVDDAVFVVSTQPGFSAAKVDLREGRLVVQETVARFGIELPASATLTSLAVEVDGILPDPKAATGSVQALLENIAWQDWSAPELSLDASLASDQANVAARGMVLGSEISLNAEAPVAREENRFVLGNANGTFNLADVSALLRGLAPKVPAIQPEVPVPASSVSGQFQIGLSENQLQDVNAEVKLQPVDPELATPVEVKGRWAPDQPVTAEVALDGVIARGSYDITGQSYEGTLALNDFTTNRIQRWLDIAKVQIGGRGDVSGTWSGNGQLKEGVHKGLLSLTQATFTRDEAPAITAIGSVNYDWPARFEATGMRVQMDDQSIALDAALGDGMLELRRFVWSRGTEELAEGRGTIPVPEDFSKWKEMLTNDARSLDVEINSRVMSLGTLKEWAPALSQLDPRSTGQLGINISGTYADPIVDIKLEARDLRSPLQPNLPPADLKIGIIGREGRIRLEGDATAPDFSPAVIRAEMAFRPAEWADDPSLITKEDISARVDLPRLDLSRFSSLVPAAEQISGILTGNVAVSGKIEKPEIRGSLELTNGGFRIKEDKFPAIEAVALAVDLSLERVELKRLSANIAGGTLQGNGSVAFNGGNIGEISLQIRGNHLPLARNEFLILRANANLRLQGTLANSTISGTVGAVDSIFYRDIELLPIGTPFTGPSAAALPKIDSDRNPTSGVPEPFRNWGLNVTVRTDEPVIVRGNLANGGVSGSMRVGGTIGNPAPSGSFMIRDFRASLPFSTLSIRRGTVSFAPESGFDPILEIRGTAEPRPYQITVYAYGRASNPQLVLTSNPPLPENEIMTLLATGTTTSGLEDPSAASSRALQLLAEEMRRGRFRYGKQLRPVLALLDRVDFSLAEADPYSSDSFSTATISLTDRFFISAGLGDEGHSRSMVIWRLTFH